MLDTAVYLDALKAPGLPQAIAAIVARNLVLHSASRAPSWLSVSAISIRRIPQRPTIARL